MSNVLKMLSRGGAAAAETDPNFNQTVLLLHGDGTNGAQNNTFLDGSTNNFTITRNGNTTQGTFSPFSVGAGEWSNYFDGSGDYLSGPTDNAISTFTGDFTIEMWANFSSIAANSGLMQCLQAGPPELGWQFYWRQANTSFRLYSSALGSFDFSYTPTVGSWIHIALSRSGTSLRCFVNGTQVGTTQTMSGTVTRATVNSLQIGGGSYGITSINGYLSNARLVNGTAVYTAAFTPPTAPLTAIANTSLLTCQSNRFVDNSSNAFAITPNGDVRVTPFSPFATTAAYSAGTNGGSGYFDGSGDYLALSSDALLAPGSGDFTIECWVYVVGTLAAYEQIYNCETSGGLFFGYLAGPSTAGWGIRIGGSSDLISAPDPGISQWTHLAATRSGTTVRMFINGSLKSTVTSSQNFATAQVAIGQGSAGGSPYQGYISDLRFIKGTAQYTADFTPPTAPLTAVTNTNLLCNFTNAGILDNTGKNNLETVGNAQIDTTTKKYGTGSLEFDGTGDYLLIPYTPDLRFEGNFTIELWVNLTSKVSNFPCIVNNYSTYTTNGGFAIFAGHNSANTSKYNIAFNGSFPVIQSTSDIAYGSWTHIALVRSGSTLTLYVNGVSEGTSTQTATVVGTANNWWIGVTGDAIANSYINGFIDDLRITKGVARYTANFTAPTKEFPDL